MTTINSIYRNDYWHRFNYDVEKIFVNHYCFAQIPAKAINHKVINHL